MFKSRILTIFGTVAAATMLTVTTASATDGHEQATDPVGIGWSNDYGCAEQTEARVCFHDAGDWWSIEDRLTDGHSAVVKWRTSETETDTATKRSGYIWNTSGADTTRWKNKDYPELDAVWYYACIGDWDTKHIISCSSVQSGIA
ncbi:hypothetical protein ACWDCL_14835 [Streptomyces sp. NPDC001009]